MSLRSILFVIPALFVMLAALPPAAAQEAEASAVVVRLHESLLAVMKEADALGVKGRYERLSEPIKKSFHMARMISIATGSFWRNASKDQRQRLVEAFTRMSVGVYASRFNGFSGESFEVTGEKPGPRRTFLVRTRIVLPADPPVPITYVMERNGTSWHILDVLLSDSISELAVRKSEYLRVLKKDGVDGLIATLNRKADQLLEK